MNKGQCDMKKSYIAAAAALCAVCLTGCAEENSKNDVRAETGIYTEITPAAVTAAITENPIPGASAETNPAETESGVCAGITEKILETVEMSSMAEVGSDRLHIYLNCELPQDCDFFP